MKTQWNSIQLINCDSSQVLLSFSTSLLFVHLSLVLITFLVLCALWTTNHTTYCTTRYLLLFNPSRACALHNRVTESSLKEVFFRCVQIFLRVIVLYSLTFKKVDHVKHMPHKVHSKNLLQKILHFPKLPPLNNSRITYICRNKQKCHTTLLTDSMT